MMKFMESGAGRLAARIQSISAGFDPEVLSLPGGSLIAALLWLYGSVMTSLTRPPPQTETLVASAATPACAGCSGGR